MKLRIIVITIALLSYSWSSSAQCLSGGCEVGLSTSQTENGIFVGNYENGKKSGLGIVYQSDVNGRTSIYANYIGGEKSGVEYTQTYSELSSLVTHTFTGYQNDVIMYPAFRISKEDRKMMMEVSFGENLGWQKYSGDKTKGNLEIQGRILEDTPTFFALNGSDEIMEITATISSIEVLTSSKTDKYYNGLQLDITNDRILVSHFPKAGANITRFRNSVNWDFENPDTGVWLYRRYFNEELSYKQNYNDVLELPSEKEVKEQKVQKAFDFIAEQVEDYDFNKGYEGKLDDFIDMLTDIKQRAEGKGLDVSYTYDMTMMKLHLQNGNRNRSLYYAQNAYRKSPSCYAAISNLVTTKYCQFEDIIKKVKIIGEDHLVIASD